MENYYCFGSLLVGAVFMCNGNKCEKVSSRTARLLDEDKVFYFGKTDLCTRPQIERVQ